MQQSSANIMDIFVKRPVLSIVLSVVICLLGIWAAIKIPVLQFPRIESSSLIVNTYYTGASAEVVKGFVTEPIERVVATVPGVEYVDSLTTSGLSTVTAWLNLNEDSTRALAELNTRLSQIRYELPPGAEDPVVEVRRADRPFAVFYLDVASEGLSASAVTDYLTRQVNPRLTTIEGVQRITIEGARTPAMRVWLDPDRLAMFDLSAVEVFDALAANNTISTLGFSESNSQRIDIVANTQLSDVSEFELLVVQQLDNTTVYLRDVARIELGSEDANVTARLDNKDTVYIAVWPLPGANEIHIGDQLYEAIEAINPTLPMGMKIGFAYDGTLYMRNALREILTTLVETVTLVGIVVLFMMGSLRTALVPLVTIPISILGALAAMAVMGFSINLLTVLAIVLSVGLVVDDAIVVVENVARLMRQGVPRLQAALMSSRQLMVPIIAMTLTLAAVYSPIGFLSGLTGTLFKEFAFSLAVAVLVSGVVALTLSPIMSAYVNADGGREGRLTKQVNLVFERLQQSYGRLLDKLFSWRNQLIVGAAILATLAVPFYMFSAKELAPIEDQSHIFMIVQSPPQSSLSYNVEHVRPVVDKMLEIDGVNEMWQVMLTSGGFAGLDMVEPHERDFAPQDKLPEVYGTLSQFAALDMLPILTPSLPSAGQFDVELVVKSSASYQEMKLIADELVGAAYGSGKFLFADTDLKIDMPQIRLELDKQKIADLGMRVTDVSGQLAVLLSSNYVNRFDSDGKAYRVIPIVGDDIRSRPEQILNLTLKTPAGDLIPVSSVASIEWHVQPRSLSTFSQQNSFKIYGGAAPGVTKEQALVAIEQAAATILPKGYSIDYAGESRAMRKEGNTLLSVLAVSSLIVFLILAVQFNSFRDPLVVLFGCVPLALAGALALPFFELTTINIYSQIGLVTLIGLIAKNGILIVEFANHVQAEGKTKVEAVKEAAMTRMRPVLMTTAATVLGHFPLVLVTGAGAEARNSIGIILVAGMFIGTFFTLLVLPAFYLWLAEDKQALKGLQKELAAQQSKAA
ncbi:acriflavine resistance protein B [Neiella marina]|uniref:Acriflavine resistance protein B n=1 Tax=Neiella marina TaxID=508461 RepID=A0A8J2U2W8_9GAMM|nr:efflux RND transporter permease subunit [Neiella marina]GGA68273.1 acriflavine resistance protein B [Neiella marina]